MRLKNTLLSLFFLVAFAIGLSAQSKISRIEPPNWWAGMQNPKVQLLIYGEKIGDLNPGINYPGVSIERVIKVKNDNYLFVDLLIEKTAKPGTLQLDFSKDGKLIESHNWPLLQRAPGSAQRTGFDNADVLYLITPDRFANGDPTNDAIPGMREKPNRSFPGGRHGGDIEGIRQQLDYLKDMGFTAIWVNPVLENDMERYSYHGYSTTDFYKVDPRFGSNEAYRQLASEAKAKGIKVIMDMIVNHCGSEHWWMKDLPSDDWINTWPTYTETNHRKSAMQDPYVSAIDKKTFTDGWFVPTMPDLNQRNELMANYLTQNTIWWVEYADISGIRMDTYPYPDEDYMSEWTRRVMEEYPHFNIVGEEWNENPAIVAYWQKGKINPNGYTSQLKSLMDFPVQMALAKALQKDGNWNILYETVAQDFLYADPFNLVTLPDNHDMPRFFAQVGEDFGLFKLGIAFTLTVRGIPQIFYGTEILMTSPRERNDGIIRSDFPGGWAGDKVNGFTGQGLSKQQTEARDFLKKILRWRLRSSAVQTGKMMHFAPQNGVYVFFRYDQQQRVMVILNKNESVQMLNLDRFAEMLHGVSEGKDVLTDVTYELKKQLELPAKTPLILELK